LVVTGVQTCALPICGWTGLHHPAAGAEPGARGVHAGRLPGLGCLAGHGSDLRPGARLRNRPVWRERRLPPRDRRHGHPADDLVLLSAPMPAARTTHVPPGARGYTLVELMVSMAIDTISSTSL